MSDLHHESIFKKEDRRLTSLIFLFVLMLIIGSMTVYAMYKIGVNQGLRMAKSNNTQMNYFHDSSSTYLRGCKLDLPEEISVLDPGYTYVMSAYRDSIDVIHIGFTGIKINKINIISSDSSQYEDYKSDIMKNTIKEIININKAHLKLLEAHNSLMDTKIKLAIQNSTYYAYKR